MYLLTNDTFSERLFSTEQPLFMTTRFHTTFSTAQDTARH